MNPFVRDIADASLSVDSGDGSPRLITGWAHRYGVLSEPMRIGGRLIRERFMPGAFREDLGSGRDLRCLINHDKNQVLGRQSAGTLAIEETDEGIRFEVSPPDTQFARDLAVSIDRGDVTGCSFRFAAPLKQRIVREGDEIVRQINRAGIREVSIVTWPAYERGSSVEVRSIADDDLQREIEELTDGGRAARLSARRRQLRQAAAC